MASTNFIDLGQFNITSNTTVVGTSKGINNYAMELIASSEVVSRVDGSYTVTIQHSPNGISWFTLVTIGAQSSVRIDIQQTTNFCLPFVRASITSTTVTTGATLSVKLYYKNQK